MVVEEVVLDTPDRVEAERLRQCDVFEHAAQGLAEEAALLVRGSDDGKLGPERARRGGGKFFQAHRAGRVGHVRRHLEKHQLRPRPAAEPERDDLPLHRGDHVQQQLPIAFGIGGLKHEMNPPGGQGAADFEAGAIVRRRGQREFDVGPATPSSVTPFARRRTARMGLLPAEKHQPRMITHRGNRLQSGG